MKPFEVKNFSVQYNLNFVNCKEYCSNIQNRDCRLAAIVWYILRVSVYVILHISLNYKV